MRYTPQEITQGVLDGQRRVDSKLVAAVANRLNLALSDVTIVEHRLMPSGWTVPVFRVPLHAVQTAQANGLEVVR